jgi:hypothetical protein
LERWLGADVVAKISESMRNWYGPPIAMHGVPGAVYAAPGGDFVGRIRAGGEVSAIERGAEVLRAARALSQVRFARAVNQHGGFASLSALIASASSGKGQMLSFHKIGATGVSGVTNSLWGVGNLPPAGADGSAAPGGRACNSATTGAFSYVNPAPPDTMHFVTAWSSASVSSNTLLLYDRLFDVAKAMNSTAPQAVTGVPTRYQNTTAGAPDYIGGNFLFVEVGGTALAATAHNWDVCTYTDQANAASTMPSLAGNSGAIVRRLDHPAYQWFAPLAPGDVGIKALTQMQCSAAVATGAINFVIGHPIAFMPCPVASMVCTVDGINTALSLSRIFDGACLAWLEMSKPSTTATTYSGLVLIAAGS